MSDLVGIPEDRFSHNEAQFISVFESTTFKAIEIYRIAVFIATQMKYPISLLYMLRNAKTDFLRCIGYQSFIKKTYKARFIANSSSCTATEISKLLTSCLTAIKAKVINYCETVFERSGKIFSGL